MKEVANPFEGTGIDPKKAYVGKYKGDVSKLKEVSDPFAKPVEKESIGNKILKITSPFRQIAGGVASSVGTFGAKAVGSALKGGEYIGEKLGQAQEKIFGLDQAVTPAPLKGLGQRTVERATQAEGTIQKKFGQDIQGKPLTEISKGIADIAQTVAIGPKAPTFGKAGISTIGKVFSKEGAKQVGRAALQGAAEGAIYSAGAEGKVDPTTVGVSAGIEAAFPVVGLGVKAASKGLAGSVKKLAAKLETSGIMNPAKFDTIKSRLIEEGVDQGKDMKADDVANWMLQRGLKGSPEDMAEQALDISTKSQEAKKGILQLSEGTYTPKEAKFVIDDMLKELKGSASDEFRTLYGQLSGMKTKLQKSGLTLADLDFIRGKAWDVLNPFTASGKVIRSAKDTKNVISGLKRFIEKTADAEGLSAKAGYEGKHIIRDLNNQTAIAKEVGDAILRKESTSATAEIMSFLASKGGSMLGGGILGSQAGPFNSNTIEGKVGNILLGALGGSLVSNTRVKSNLANFLNKASGAEKSALYEWMKSRGSKEATAGVKKMINSVSAILSKQTTNDLRPMRSPVVSPANSNVDSSVLAGRSGVNAPSGTAKVISPVKEISEDFDEIVKRETNKGVKKQMKGDVLIPASQKIKRMIDSVEGQEQNVGKIGGRRTSGDYKRQQSISVNKKKERIVEIISEEYGVDKNDAVDIYDMLRDRKKQ